MVSGMSFGSAQSRTVLVVSAVAICVGIGVITMTALLKDLVRAVPGIAELNKPIVATFGASTQPYTPADLEFANLRLVRHPVSWRVREVEPIRFRQTKTEWIEWSVLEIARDARITPISCLAIPATRRIDDMEIRRAFNVLFPFSPPAISPEEFHEKFPSDKSVAIACTKLSAGDPAQGGRLLLKHEQWVCALGFLCKRTLGSRIPTQVENRHLTVIVGSGVQAVEVRPFSKLWVFEEKGQEGAFLTFTGPKAAGHSPSEVEKALVEVAVTFGGCLEPLSADQPGKRSKEK